MVVEQTGYLDNFFRVYASEETKVNVLCFVDVMELYEISFDPVVGFTVHMPDRDLVFKQRGKLFVADFIEEGVVGAMVLSTQAFTKAEVERAKRAYEFIENAGYPSYQEAVNMLQDGNISNMPSLNAEDIRRADALFGYPPAYVRGRLTWRKAARAIVDDDLILDEKRQKMHTDVMHLDRHHFVVTVCEPLMLTLQAHIARETLEILGATLQNQIQILRSKGFRPVRIYSDPQSAFRGLTNKFESMEVDTGGAEDFVPVFDAKIRRIKEVYRSVKASLKWTLPPILVKELVAYCVSRMNVQRTSAINQNVAPRVLFTGMKVDYRMELELRFGEYCEVYDGTDNTSRARSIPCVALYPCNNAAGSWAFMNLLSKKIVRRSQWVKMHTSKEFIKRMNSFDGDGLRPIQADAVEIAETAPAPEPAMAAGMPAVPNREQEPAEVAP